MMKIDEKKQKTLIAVLAIVCVALVAFCVVMLACKGGSRGEVSPTDDYVYNPGETGLDENGNTIIVDLDDGTEELDSIPNGADGMTSDSDIG